MDTLIKKFTPSPELFLNRSTIICGATGTGKSSIVIDILWTLLGFADQIIVFSPNDPQNRTYERSAVPRPLIHYQITEPLLAKIWERQTAFSEIYTKISKLENLARIFERIPRHNCRVYSSKLEKIDRAVRDQLSALPPKEQAIRRREFQEKCDEPRIKIYKAAILENQRFLLQEELSEEQRFIVEHIDFNPNIVIVFDDCTEMLEKLKKSQSLQGMFYRGRWARISLIIACHTDKTLDPAFKKNAHLVIFTAPAEAGAYFGRDSTSMTAAKRREAESICASIFRADVKWQKLVWNREKLEYYSYIAEKHEDFQFGARIIREFCKQIAATGSESANNPFMKNFH